MLHLPVGTEISRTLPKKSFFAKCGLGAPDRQRFDDEIRQMFFVNEISPATVNCSAGDQVKAVFVLRFVLRTKKCDKRNLLLFSKGTRQHVLFLLEHDERARLAIVHAGHFFQTEWRPVNEWRITLIGLGLDAIWQNLVAQISGIKIAEEHSLNDALKLAKQSKDLEEKIAALQKKVSQEKQFNRRVEMNAELKRLRVQMGKNMGEADCQ